MDCSHGAFFLRDIDRVDMRGSHSLSGISQCFESDRHETTLSVCSDNVVSVCQGTFSKRVLKF